MVVDVAALGPRRQLEAPTRGDWLLAAGVALVGQFEVWVPALPTSNVVGSRLVNAVGYAAVSVALAWRRGAPLIVLAFVAAASSMQHIAVGASQGLGGFLPPWVAMYAVGRYAPTGAITLAAPLLLLGTVVHELRDPIFEFGGAALTFWILLVAAWPLGQASRARDLRETALAEQTAALARERDERARAAVAAERERIARELHDVVGHAVSVIVVQAVAAEGLLERVRVHETRERIGVIEETAREALAEMRRLVGLLDDEGGSAITPQPGLAALDGLIEGVRHAGLAAELVIKGTPTDLPPGLELACYRIIQEALTNTLKHAGAERAWVNVCYSADTLELEVVDDGRGPAGDGSLGRGLIGMRQRAALYRGRLEAGAQPGGGYRVRAQIPLTEAAR